MTIFRTRSRLALQIIFALAVSGCGGDAAPPVTSAPATTLASLTSASTGAAPAVPAISRLQRYQIDPAKIFVAGISSGGFAAVQMHIAHSSTFKGAAIYAGGVYWCAGLEGAAGALANCGGQTLPTNEASYNSTLAASQAYLDAQSSLGTIDPAANLAGQPVYLWSGTQDVVVNPREMADLSAEYQH
jgi:poly(3-hydroxybutyrate) depolymerase